MLTTSTNNPVSEMERNVKKDQRLLLIVAFLNFFNLGNMLRRHPGGLSSESQVLLYVLVAGIVLFLGWYFFRIKRAIVQLRLSDQPTYRHILNGIDQIRALMKSRAHVALAFVLLAALTVAYGQSKTILRSFHAGTIDWSSTVLLLSAATALLVFIVFIGRRKQQRLYGRHLDRLEAALRELRA